MAVGLDGKPEVASARGDRPMGYSIDWLPVSEFCLLVIDVNCGEARCDTANEGISETWHR